mmetsp:Transcript_21875/g.58997  ORF Transcript_21875/g.58997 Transcript_21875/m.58997 type:complete len:275 (-) Transcript_21875:1906-2730(-)
MLRRAGERAVCGCQLRHFYRLSAPGRDPQTVAASGATWPPAAPASTLSLSRRNDWSLVRGRRLWDLCDTRYIRAGRMRGTSAASGAQAQRPGPARRLCARARWCGGRRLGQLTSWWRLLCMHGGGGKIQILCAQFRHLCPRLLCRRWRCTCKGHGRVARCRRRGDSSVFSAQRRDGERCERASRSVPQPAPIVTAAYSLVLPSRCEWEHCLHRAEVWVQTLAGRGGSCFGRGMCAHRRRALANGILRAGWRRSGRRQARPRLRRSSSRTFPGME